MKRTVFLVAILALCAGVLMADGPVKIGFVTDGYVISNDEGGEAAAGQDINLDVGPASLDLTADWTKTLWDGGSVLELAYILGYSQTFGIFTPKIELTGDRSLDLLTKEWSGDLFSDLIPQLGIVFGKVGADAYADLSFEEGYDLLQTIDASAFLNFGLGTVRAGILYMNTQAVTDDVGYPNAPAAKEGTSFYAKAKIEY